MSSFSSDANLAAVLFPEAGGGVAPGTVRTGPTGEAAPLPTDAFAAVFSAAVASEMPATTAPVPEVNGNAIARSALPPGRGAAFPSLAFLECPIAGDTTAATADAVFADQALTCAVPADAADVAEPIEQPKEAPADLTPPAIDPLLAELAACALLMLPLSTSETLPVVPAHLAETFNASDEGETESEEADDAPDAATALAPEFRPVAPGGRAAAGLVGVPVNSLPAVPMGLNSGDAGSEESPRANASLFSSAQTARWALPAMSAVVSSSEPSLPTERSGMSAPVADGVPRADARALSNVDGVALGASALQTLRSAGPATESFLTSTDRAMPTASRVSHDHGFSPVEAERSPIDLPTALPAPQAGLAAALNSSRNASDIAASAPLSTSDAAPALANRPVTSGDADIVSASRPSPSVGVDSPVEAPLPDAFSASAGSFDVPAPVTSAAAIAWHGRTTSATSAMPAVAVAPATAATPAAEHVVAQVASTAPGAQPLTRETRPSRAPIDPAKTAARGANVSGERETAEFAGDKSFLSGEGESLTSSRATLGIDVAKPASAMVAAPAFTTESSPAGAFAREAHPDFADMASREITAVEGTAPSSPSASAENAAPVEAVASAERAVEVVLRAVDRVESREQQSVNLRFSVGGDALDVRVELHANEVRAVFRTESPELRAALSHEWTALQATQPRAVTPVFTSSDANAFAQSHGEAATQQRDTPARRTREERAIAGVGRSRRTGGADFSSSVLAPVTSARPRTGTSLHLHTLA